MGLCISEERYSISGTRVTIRLKSLKSVGELRQTVVAVHRPSGSGLFGET